MADAMAQAVNGGVAECFPDPQPTPGPLGKVVTINDARISDDLISFSLGPDSALPGTFNMVLKGRPGTPDYPLWSNISNVAPGGYVYSFRASTIPEGQYQAVEASLTSSGTTVSDVKSTWFTSLGLTNHTRYNTPYENLCHQNPVNVFLSHSEDGYQSCGWNVGQAKDDFRFQVNLNGSGYSDNYSVVQLEWTFACSGSTAHNDYWRPYGEVMGSHGSVNESTVAFYPDAASAFRYGITYGDRIAIIGVGGSNGVGGQNLVKTITDRCPDCADGSVTRDQSYPHFDNYTFAVGCTKHSVPSLGTFTTILLDK